MVSHIDDDHINGILDLLPRATTRRRRRSSRSRTTIQTLWHNSFDDLLDNRGGAAVATMAASVAAGCAEREPAEDGARNAGGDRLDAARARPARPRAQAEGRGQQAVQGAGQGAGEEADARQRPVVHRDRARRRSHRRVSGTVEEGPGQDREEARKRRRRRSRTSRPSTWPASACWRRSSRRPCS